ncbi:MAG: class 3 adenylate cyclase [Devosia sp.]
MTVAEDIKNRAQNTFRKSWTTRLGRVVPAATSLTMGNDAVELESATVLYADLDSSTDLVDTKIWEFAAEIYKTFLYAASRLILSEGGVITAYDGDRVMGVFVDGLHSVAAARCALKINYAVKSLVQPAIAASGWRTDFQLKHVVGLDRSPLRAARTGVRGDNDLVWVGRAANHAAKLTALPATTPTWITEDVFKCLDDSTWYSRHPRSVMWTERAWSEFNGSKVYGSTYWWPVT